MSREDYVSLMETLTPGYVPPDEEVSTSAPQDQDHSHAVDDAHSLNRRQQQNQNQYATSMQDKEKQMASESQPRQAKLLGESQLDEQDVSMEDFQISHESQKEDLGEAAKDDNQISPNSPADRHNGLKTPDFQGQNKTSDSHPNFDKDSYHLFTSEDKRQMDTDSNYEPDSENQTADEHVNRQDLALNNLEVSEGSQRQSLHTTSKTKKLLNSHSEPKSKYLNVDPKMTGPESFMSNFARYGKKQPQRLPRKPENKSEAAKLANADPTEQVVLRVIGLEGRDKDISINKSVATHYSPVLRRAFNYTPSNPQKIKKVYQIAKTTEDAVLTLKRWMLTEDKSLPLPPPSNTPHDPNDELPTLVLVYFLAKKLEIERLQRVAFVRFHNCVKEKRDLPAIIPKWLWEDTKEGDMLRESVLNMCTDGTVNMPPEIFGDGYFPPELVAELVGRQGRLRKKDSEKRIVGRSRGASSKKR
ncbi:hypothetical protein GLAREA_00268 [Glarea lozoyensis ATCC 20868]|uniref:Uncharacterized protein n=1 Tax=Glarea lozoyensis (strain ATCC 20868 / MF5171) TaxID=1116229 RepID=S3CTW1_GLAL2|nr:uncharacterized protein GLAREA_00268 [Glarea lozoyensis ATCC 20868]EPE29110.1 hypothetical protein GLAREA_00268 [Glarea lozoyensis ATCC 20868]